MYFSFAYALSSTIYSDKETSLSSEFERIMEIWSLLVLKLGFEYEEEVLRSSLNKKKKLKLFSLYMISLCKISVNIRVLSKFFNVAQAFVFDATELLCF
jgi:hypothetical protein